MLAFFPYFLVMIASIVLLNILAKKLRIAYPILLVVAGLVVSLFPELPNIVIDPEVIFLIFLPPLLCEAS